MRNYIGTAGWPFIVTYRINFLDKLIQKKYKIKMTLPPIALEEFKIGALVAPWGGAYYSLQRAPHEKLHRYTLKFRRKTYTSALSRKLIALGQTPKGRLRRLNTLQVHVLQKCAISFPRYYDTKIAARYCTINILENAYILSPNMNVTNGRKIRVLGDSILGGVTKVGVPESMLGNKFAVFHGLKRKIFLHSYGARLFGDDWLKSSTKRRAMKRLIRAFKHKFKNNLMLDFLDLGKLHYLSLRILEKSYDQIISTVILNG